MKTPTAAATAAARRCLNERGAVDPILILGAIAVLLVLTVGGFFATTAWAKSAQDSLAQSDVDRMSAVEEMLHSRSGAYTQNINDLTENDSGMEFVPASGPRHYADSDGAGTYYTVIAQSQTGRWFLRHSGQARICTGDTMYDAYQQCGLTPPISDVEDGETTGPEEEDDTAALSVPGNNVEVDETISFFSPSSSTSFRATYTVKNNQSSPQRWSFTVNTTRGPFNGVDPANYVFDSNYTVSAVSDTALTIAAPAYQTDLPPGQSVTFGFNVWDPPSTPFDRELATVSWSTPGGNSNWWACVDLEISTTEIYPVEWSTVIDLDEHFRSLDDSKELSFINANYERISGNKYRLTGLEWNHLVSVTNPVTSPQVCYKPMGEPW